jgi:hypothetical protein
MFTSSFRCPHAPGLTERLTADAILRYRGPVRMTDFADSQASICTALPTLLSPRVIGVVPTPTHDAIASLPITPKQSLLHRHWVALLLAYA